MKRCVVNFKSGFVNISADRLEREEDIIFVYDGEKLCGVFDLGFIDSIHLSDVKEDTKWNT